ncbi:hypothetical protein [Kaarinaea lacus]
MNIRYLYFIPIAFIALVACDSSDDEELNQIFTENTTYLVYESAQSLVAIDPRAPQQPLTIEPTNNSLSGIRIADNLIKVSDDVSLIVNDSLAYAKDGKLWHTSLNLDRTLTIERISSESSAFDVCFASLYTALQKPIYYYSLPGPDLSCYPTYTPDNSGNPFPIFTDNIAKWTSLDADIMTQPESGGISPHITMFGESVLFFDTTQPPKLEISGLLTLENSGELLWYEGRDFTAPVYTVANNVTQFNNTYIQYKNAAYIIVNGGLYRYEAKDTVLGESVYEMQTQGFNTIAADRYSSGVLYLLDGSNLLILSTTQPASPTLLARNDIFADSARLLGTTQNHVIFFKQLTDAFATYSVNKQNGDIQLLFTVPRNSNHFRPETIIEYDTIYYTDQISSLTGFVSADGKVKHTLPDTLIIGRIRNPVISESQSFYSHILMAHVSSTASIDVLAFNSQKQIR